ncbi:MAG: MarR family transcriptional regulator [Nanoarchaeota archaeon]|nr:MarR family transcriptional regulator [Nanoarchaeota archaeon]
MSLIIVMENKNVGWLVLGISILIIGIIFLFNNAMKTILDNSCPLDMHEDICPAYGTITQQTYLSLAIVGILIIVALVLILSKPQERVVVRKIKERKTERKINLSGFKSEERKVFGLIKENGTIFQGDLIEKTGFGKAKISRIIDRLEGKGFVERKRRGLTNVVVLKRD